jgi:hypothetical protein
MTNKHQQSASMEILNFLEKKLNEMKRKERSDALDKIIALCQERKAKIDIEDNTEHDQSQIIEYISEILTGETAELIETTKNMKIIKCERSRTDYYVTVEKIMDFKTFEIMIYHSGPDKNCTMVVNALHNKKMYVLYDSKGRNSLDVKEIKKLYKNIKKEFKSTSCDDFQKFIEIIVELNESLWDF